MARESKSKSKETEHDPSLGPKVTAVHVGDDSLLERLVPHMKKIGIALVVLALILTVYFSYRWYQHDKAEKSTQRLANALEVVDRPVIPEDDANPLPGDKLGDHFKTYAERADKGLAALGKVGQLRGAASLFEAHLLVEAGKLDQALAMYRRLGNGPSLDAVIAREGIGTVLETQAGASKDPAAGRKLLEDALTAYRASQPDDKGPRRDYSLYHEGRVLAALGKKSEAIAQLKKALTVAPGSDLKGLIEMQLSSLGEGT